MNVEIGEVAVHCGDARMLQPWPMLTSRTFTYVNHKYEKEGEKRRVKKADSSIYFLKQA
jgi:hypothetical protein